MSGKVFFFPFLFIWPQFLQLCSRTLHCRFLHWFSPTQKKLDIDEERHKKISAHYWNAILLPLVDVWFCMWYLVWLNHEHVGISMLQPVRHAQLTAQQPIEGGKSLKQGPQGKGKPSHEGQYTLGNPKCGLDTLQRPLHKIGLRILGWIPLFS